MAIDLGQQPPSLFRQRQQAGGLENLQATMDVFDSLAPYANLQIIRTGDVDNAEKPWLAQSIEAAITLTGVQAPQVVFGVQGGRTRRSASGRPAIIYQTDGPDNPRLRLIKLASCGNALPGEEVEFTLRFDNIGDQVIGNVTIVDNLSTRFEYVPESAKSSVDANFITEPNDTSSPILRWEIKTPLKAGRRRRAAVPRARAISGLDPARSRCRRLAAQSALPSCQKLLKCERVATAARTFARRRV